MPSGKTIAAASIPGANNTPTAEHLGKLAIAPTSMVRTSANTNDHAHLRRCGFSVWLTNITSLASLLALVVRIADFVRHMLLWFRLPAAL
jgi:hypothetical protein